MYIHKSIVSGVATGIIHSLVENFVMLEARHVQALHEICAILWQVCIAHKHEISAGIDYGQIEV